MKLKLGMALSLTVLTLSLIVMMGWIIHSVIMVQILPTLVPVQFNTALGLGLCAAALIGYQIDHPKLAVGLACVAFTLASLTLFQYLSKISLGIDTLFVTPFVDTYSPNPGRMSINTGLAMLLYSLMLVIKPWMRSRYPKTTAFIYATTGGLVAGMGFVSLFGYLSSIETYGWAERFSKMSPLTAFCFLLLGIALITRSRQHLVDERKINKWVLAVLLPLVLISFVIITYAVRVQEIADLSINRGHAIQQAKHITVNQMSRYLDAYKRLRYRLALAQIGSNASSHPRWREAALLLFKEAARFEGLALVDNNLQIIDVLMADKSQRSQAMLRYREQFSTLSPRLFNSFDISKDLIVFVRIQDRAWLVSPTPTSDGFILGLINFDQLVDDLNQTLSADQVLIHQLTVDGIQLTKRDQEDDADLVNKMSEVYEHQLDIVINSSARAHGALGFSINWLIWVMFISLLTALSYLVLVVINLRGERAKLALSLMRQENSMNAMIDGLVLIDKSGQILDHNQALATIFKYPQEGLVGQNISILMNTNQAKQHDGWLARYSESRVSTIVGKNRVMRAKRFDGSELPIELQVTTFVDQGERYFIGVLSDLSEQFESRKLLEEKEAMLRGAFDATTIGFTIESSDERFVEVNDAFVAWLNSDVVSLLGERSEHYIDESSKALRCKVRTALWSGEQSTVTYEMTFCNNEGQTKIGFVSDVIVSQGSVPVILSLIIDITERKQLEINLTDRNRALSRANRELERFAFVASHDLKEPLRSLNSFSSYLIEDIRAGDLERAAEDQQFIDESCRRMTKLIDALLSYSRIGYSELKMEAVDLNKVFDQIQLDLSDRLKESNGSIKLAKALPTIVGDPQLLLQLFQNLIQNALKFRKDEVDPIIDVEWRYISSEQQVVGEATEQPAACELILSDNGIGIPEAYISKAFEPFVKVHNLPREQGAGIGLSIVMRIIERHGGSLSVESTVGAGTRFKLRFPLDGLANSSDAGDDTLNTTGSDFIDYTFQDYK